MKKVLKVLMVALALLLVLGTGAFLLLKSQLPEQEEYISYEKTKQIQQIDAQLKEMDLEKIRAKAPLIMEKSIDEIQKAVTDGKLTYEELTAFYLDRIETYDTGEKGINAVAEINPKAIEEARACDSSTGKAEGIKGIPVLIKDNVNTKDMPTSGGTYALKDFLPSKNAELVEELIKSDAVILGKSNLSELANFMDTKMPSGYSSKAGQTHNPFDPITLSPLGSSSGSGAAVAANFCAVAIGTETTGSIIAPSAIHSLVGLKPTKNSISAKGVIPLSSTMDTVGTMAKSVKDVAVLYNAAISDKTKSIELKFDADYLQGKRIGVVGDDEEQTLTKTLQGCGAETVIVTLAEKGIDSEYIINQDFKTDLNQYLITYSAPVKSLAELIAFNEKDMGRRAKYGQTLIEKANKVTEFDKAKVSEIVREAQSRIDLLLSNNRLDAIVFFDNNGVLLPAVAGYPELTVPVGKSEIGAPRGATFVSGKGEDEKLTYIAYSFEQKTMARLIPNKYLKQ